MPDPSCTAKTPSQAPWCGRVVGLLPPPSKSPCRYRRHRCLTLLVWVVQHKQQKLTMSSMRSRSLQVPTRNAWKACAQQNRTLCSTVWRARTRAVRLHIHMPVARPPAPPYAQQLCALRPISHAPQAGPRRTAHSSCSGNSTGAVPGRATRPSLLRMRTRTPMHMACTAGSPAHLSLIHTPPACHTASQCYWHSARRPVADCHCQPGWRPGVT